MSDSRVIAAEIINLYRHHGGADYIGEPVSQLEHMYQMAQLAEAAGYDEEVILAAFFHDIGHLLQQDQDRQTMDGFGNMDHEALGATFLRTRGCSERLVELVSSHVDAKRYLVVADPDYEQTLTHASRETLRFQGGGMSRAEMSGFEADPLFELKVQFRRWDDQAKQTGISTEGWEHIGALIQRHLDRHY